MDSKNRDGQKRPLSSIIHGRMIMRRIARVSPIESFEPFDLRNWWHSILGTYGRYNCCAFFLTLPSDLTTIFYLQRFGQELQLITGDKCLLMAMTDKLAVDVMLNEILWIKAIDEHTNQGYSIAIGEYFGIKFTDFPCLVIFNDIRSTEHVTVTLKELTYPEIADKMRHVFSIVQDAAKERKTPLSALEAHRKNEVLRNKGKMMVSRIRSLAEKTFDAALEAFVKTRIP